MTDTPTLAVALIAGCPTRPCSEALTWLGRRRAPARAWAECPQGDWLLWILAQAGIRPPLEWAAREIVAHAFGYAASAMEAAELREQAVSLREHEAALRGAVAETAAGILSAAVRAARAADAVAEAAARAAAAARWAVGAAGAAGWTVGAAGAAPGGVEHRRCADAVRRLYPKAPSEVLALLAGPPR